MIAYDFLNGIGYENWYAAEQAWAAENKLKTGNRTNTEDPFSQSLVPLTEEKRERLTYAFAQVRFPDSEVIPKNWRVFRFAAVLPSQYPNQTVVGDWAELKTSIHQLAFNERHFDDYNTDDFEDLDAVRHLCAWWNAKAPKGAQEAGCFRFHVWNAKGRTFDVIGEGQDPDLDEDYLKSLRPSSDYTLFEQPGKPTVLAFFLAWKKTQQVYQWKHSGLSSQWGCLLGGRN